MNGSMGWLFPDAPLLDPPPPTPIRTTVSSAPALEDDCWILISLLPTQNHRLTPKIDSLNHELPTDTHQARFSFVPLVEST